MSLLFQHRTCRETAIFYLSKRYFDWQHTLNKNTGKPAISGSKYLFVPKYIPVVLLQDIPSLGVKGQVVDVKRGKSIMQFSGDIFLNLLFFVFSEGYARTVLFPRKLAVTGSMWENIDEFADPKLMEDPSLKAVASLGKST